MLKSARLTSKLISPELLEKEKRDFAYLDSLKSENLLFPFLEEAGLAGSLSYFKGTEHGGWDASHCQIRGTFTGHYLSAMANRYEILPDDRLKAQLEYLVDELAHCQVENGGEWVFSIPEKYLLALKKGQHFWAPHYVCQKLLSGLFRVYQAISSDKALDIISHAADWFLNYTVDYSQKAMQELFNLEETGAMLELWANLYGATQEEKYRLLMEKYTRYDLLDPLLAGRDIFTNMHANTTIPEVHGFARSYEVTGEEKYRRAVVEYWKQTIEERGLFASGSQTSGEVWTPKQRQQSRLGEMTQEHCVVYNSIRLADYLFRWTGEAQYADFIEKNLYNGILAQTFWESRRISQIDFDQAEDEGIVTYYLPLAAGSQKKWGNRLDHFWCCHCTAVEANTSFRNWLSYTDGHEITIAQYFSHQAIFELENVSAKLNIESGQEMSDETIRFTDRVTAQQKGTDFPVKISIESEAIVKVRLRIPDWSKNSVKVDLTKSVKTEVKADFVELIFHGTGSLVVHFEKKLYTYPLADNPTTVAFLDGPILLAGLVPEERTIFVDENVQVEDLLIPHAERVWGAWSNDYQLTNQVMNFNFRPLKEIGKEHYTVYFPIKGR